MTASLGKEVPEDLRTLLKTRFESVDKDINTLQQNVVTLRQQMAITTNGVQSFGRKRETVWVVAIGAGDTLMIHLALQE